MPKFGDRIEIVCGESIFHGFCSAVEMHGWPWARYAVVKYTAFNGLPGVVDLRVGTVKVIN